MLHSDESPLSEEITDLIGELRRFLRLEIELARTELSPKLARVGWHIAVIVAGSIIACIGLLSFAISAIIGLTSVVPPWLAASIAGVLLASGGAILIVLGKKGIGRDAIMPERTIESIKESTQRVKKQL